MYWYVKWIQNVILPWKIVAWRVEGMGLFAFDSAEVEGSVGLRCPLRMDGGKGKLFRTGQAIRGFYFEGRCDERHFLVVSLRRNNHHPLHAINEKFQFMWYEVYIQNIWQNCGEEAILIRILRTSFRFRDRIFLESAQCGVEGNGKRPAHPIYCWRRLPWICCIPCIPPKLLQTLHKWKINVEKINELGQLIWLYLLTSRPIRWYTKRFVQSINQSINQSIDQ